MGLDTSHNAWHGAYSAFGRWRDKVAETAGYAVVTVDKEPHPVVMIDWGHITKGNLYGQWEQTPPDPLLVLIAHSDCEGVIHPEQAASLADRLEGLLPLLEYADDGGGHIGGYADKTRQFIRGLRDAVAANEPVEFF